MPSSAACAPQSYLFVPGSRPERFSNALSCGADAVIIDLEDALAPPRRMQRARTSLRGVARHPVLVRINGRGTPWFEQDARIGALDGIAGIVVPKAEGLTDIVEVVKRAKRRVPIYPLIETARGMWSAIEIAKAPYVSERKESAEELSRRVNQSSI
ncbi:aldolase/citrate lyase family protein [Burkholderia sp. IMCC1007]|uniref:aldolase/citrate lyase family protein n=1 Tax=Burkholderia sp. IMCC1007 TaxID=3004104 RepID=UPI0022B36AF4|nr:aldolase/citrate lyase family protein [Burkholderia sp. IMCC1007]